MSTPARWDAISAVLLYVLRQFSWRRPLVVSPEIKAGGEKSRKNVPALVMKTKIRSKLYVFSNNCGCIC